MFEFIRIHQLNIMLALSSACLTFGLLLFVTRFLDKRKKAILIGMEFAATFLLYSDRLAYIYAGDMSTKGYVMVRVSNFLVFFLTAAVVLIFDQYLIDLILRIAQTSETVPVRLKVVAYAAVFEMVMVIISQFTGLYYYFDENNVYHRGPGFLICYIIPILSPLIQYTAVRRYLRNIGKYIYTSLLLYIFVPIAVGIVQIFTYGISIVNMAMVLVSISLYVFTATLLRMSFSRPMRIASMASSSLMIGAIFLKISASSRSLSSASSIPSVKFFITSSSTSGFESAMKPMSSASESGRNQLSASTACSRM